ncbi:FkbM family methyltransferase [Thermodesulfobacteriota bacterium]
MLKIFHLLPDGLKLFLRSYKKQEAEYYELGWLVEKSSIAIDIGANKGAYTYALCRLVGGNGKVIAIEPIRELAQSLQRASNQLRLPVTVEQCCVSDRSGTAKLYIPKLSNGELLTGFASLNQSHSGICEYEEREVPVNRLDDLLDRRKKRVSFIKCDVEGHEVNVLRGGLRVLHEDRPFLIIEIEQSHAVVSISEHFNFIINQNYNGYFLDRRKDLKSLNDFDIRVHQVSATQGGSSRGYIYNFIFLPAEIPDARLLRENYKKRRKTFYETIINRWV